MEHDLYPAGPSALPADLLQSGPTQIKHRLVGLSLLAAFSALLACLLAGSLFVVARHLPAALEGSLTSLLFVTVGLCVACSLIAALFDRVKRGLSNKPKGLELTRRDEPILYRFTDRLAKELDTDRPDRIVIDYRPNAAIHRSKDPNRRPQSTLLIGLPLVNCLTLSELKAVVAHELGHLQARNLIAGEWTTAVTSITYGIVDKNSRLYKLLLRWADLPSLLILLSWPAWFALAMMIAIQTLVRGGFELVYRGTRPMLRAVELSADQLALAAAGSNVSISTLTKLPAIEDSWGLSNQMALRLAFEGYLVRNICHLQNQIIERTREVLDDPTYGAPIIGCTTKEGWNADEIRLESSNNHSSHPSREERERVARDVNLNCENDQRPAWLLLRSGERIAETLSYQFLRSKVQVDNLATAGEEQLESRLNQYYGRESLNPRYRGVYIRKHLARCSSTADIARPSPRYSQVSHLYPKEIADSVRSMRRLEQDLERLRLIQQRGDLNQGEQLVYRGEATSFDAIPRLLSEKEAQLTGLLTTIREHDGACRHLPLARSEKLGVGWTHYLQGLHKLLHYSEHTHARLRDSEAQVRNLHAIVSSDGKISSHERQRLWRVLEPTLKMNQQVFNDAARVELTSQVYKALGSRTWEDHIGPNPHVDIHEQNYLPLLPRTLHHLHRLAVATQFLRNATLDAMLEAEHRVLQSSDDDIEKAAPPPRTPAEYGTLLPGQETKLQQSLSVWERLKRLRLSVPKGLKLLLALATTTAFLHLSNLEAAGRLDLYQHRTDDGNMTAVSRVCQNDSLVQCYQDATDYMGDDPQRLIDLLHRSCAGNSSSACKLLGWMHLDGVGLPEDTVLAARFLEKACGFDDGDSCNALGTIKYRQPTSEMSELRRLFARACSLESAQGCRNLGFMIAESGSATVLAYDTLTNACHLGSGTLCRDIGTRIVENELFSERPHAHRHFLEQGCRKNDAESCYLMARLLEANPNIEARWTADQYLRIACRRGYRSVCSGA